MDLLAVALVLLSLGTNGALLYGLTVTLQSHAKVSRELAALKSARSVQEFLSIVEMGERRDPVTKRPSDKGPYPQD